MAKPPVVKIGDKHGLLTIVAELDERNKWGRRRYQCLCECGNTLIVTTQGLTSGFTKSCGCLPRQGYHAPLVQIGGKYGRLTVIAEVSKTKYKNYKCLCECGKEKIVCSNSLIHENVRSCGCLKNPPVVHIGERYGKLTVVKETSRVTNYRDRMYECQCDCGNKSVVRSNALRVGATKSCGCLQRNHKW